MAGARASKWKKMKRKSFTHLPPDADSLRQHCYCANYLSYVLRHPVLKHHPSPVGHGWQLVTVAVALFNTHNLLFLHNYLLPGPAEENEDDGETDEDLPHLSHRHPHSHRLSVSNRSTATADQLPSMSNC